MRGTNFCSGVKDSCALLLEHAALVGTVSLISFVLLLIGKICITFLCTLVCFLVLDKGTALPFAGLGTQAGAIDSMVLPVVMTLVLSWLVATAFMDVFEITIGTILLCFCEGVKVNEGSMNYRCSESLRQYMSGAGAAGEKKGVELTGTR